MLTQFLINNLSMASQLEAFPGLSRASSAQRDAVDPSQATGKQDPQTDTGPAARVEFSPEALALSKRQQQGTNTPADAQQATQASGAKPAKADAKPAAKGAGGKQLSEAELKQVEELKKRDREVHIHEQTHMAAAGGAARGGPSYTYQSGPDGVRYAVGGEVSLDMSTEKTPEATLQKASRVRQAALAPADPSPQDRSVAAEASQMANQAEHELQAQAAQGASGKASGDQGGDSKAQAGAKPDETDKSRQADNAKPATSASKAGKAEVAEGPESQSDREQGENPSVQAVRIPSAYSRAQSAAVNARYSWVA